MSTPPLVLPHRNAIMATLAPLEGRPTGPVAISEGRAPDPVPDNGMYAVVYLSPGQATPESLADQRTDFRVDFQVTAVGPTPEKALWVADRVREALAVRLPVDGRVTWRTEELGGPPVQRDDDVTPPVYYLPVQYRLQSIPA